MVQVHVAKNIKGCFFNKLSYLVLSQNWLNLPMDPRHFWLYHKIEPKKGGRVGHCSRFCRWRFLALSGVVWRCEWDKPSAAVALLATAVELPCLPSSGARTLVEMAEKSVGRTNDRRGRRTEHDFACGNYDRERTRQFPEMGDVTDQ